MKKVFRNRSTCMGNFFKLLNDQLSRFPDNFFPFLNANKLTLIKRYDIKQIIMIIFNFSPASGRDMDLHFACYPDTDFWSKLLYEWNVESICISDVILSFNLISPLFRYETDFSFASDEPRLDY